MDLHASGSTIIAISYCLNISPVYMHIVSYDLYSTLSLTPSLQDTWHIPPNHTSITRR